MFGKLMMAGVLAVTMASAQRGGGGGDMPGMGGGMGMARRATKAEQLADKLKLSKEQRERAQAILSASREQAGTLRLELDKKRAEIAGAIIDGKSADEVSKLVSAYAEAAGQMTRLEADAFGKIYATLKPNQQSKADQAFELMAGMFGGAVGGGSGRGRGQGR